MNWLPSAGLVSYMKLSISFNSQSSVIHLLPSVIDYMSCNNPHIFNPVKNTTVDPMVRVCTSL